MITRQQHTTRHVTGLADPDGPSARHKSSRAEDGWAEVDHPAPDAGQRLEGASPADTILAQLARLLAQQAAKEEHQLVHHQVSHDEEPET